MLPLFLVSQLWLYLGNSHSSVYRTIGPLISSQNRIQVFTGHALHSFIFMLFLLSNIVICDVQKLKGKRISRKNKIIQALRIVSSVTKQVFCCCFFLC